MNLTRSREDAKEWGEEEIAEAVVDVAFQIHNELGPGLLESVYEVLLAEGLSRRGLFAERQKDVPVRIWGKKFELGFRADLIVENKVCVEVKSIEEIAPVHGKQVLTYLRLLKMKLGLLVNFGSPTIKKGIKRVVNGLESSKYSSSLRDFAASRENP